MDQCSEGWAHQLTVDEFKLAVCNQSSSLVSSIVWLFVPPSSKERNLHVNEMSVGVFQELINDSVHNVVNLIEKVLIDSHLPTRVIMGVRDQMDVNLAFVNAVCSVLRVVPAQERSWRVDT